MLNKTKHMTSALIVGIFIAMAFGSGDDTSSDSTPDSNKPMNIKQMGEPLSTRYFDVTINKATFQDRVNTGNQFANLPREQDILYLVLNTTFRNTDTESRMIMDGEVLINYNGKQYRFDHSETIMTDGWGTMLEQINPLTSKTTNIVYKIPNEVLGEIYYHPGRSSGNSLIFVGKTE